MEYIALRKEADVYCVLCIERGATYVNGYYTNEAGINVFKDHAKHGKLDITIYDEQGVKLYADKPNLRRIGWSELRISAIVYILLMILVYPISAFAVYLLPVALIASIVTLSVSRTRSEKKRIFYKMFGNQPDITLPNRTKRGFFFSFKSLTSFSGRILTLIPVTLAMLMSAGFIAYGVKRPDAPWMLPMMIIFMTHLFVLLIDTFTDEYYRYIRFFEVKPVWERDIMGNMNGNITWRELQKHEYTKIELWY